MALLLTTDGEQRTFELPTKGTDRERLKPVQAAIGGFVEMVPIPADRVLLCDEDGLLKKRPLNEVASRLAGRRVVGNALVCDTEELARWDA